MTPTPQIFLDPYRNAHDDETWDTQNDSGSQHEKAIDECLIARAIIEVYER